MFFSYVIRHRTILSNFIIPFCYDTPFVLYLRSPLFLIEKLITNSCKNVHQLQTSISLFYLLFSLIKTKLYALELFHGMRLAWNIIMQCPDWFLSWHSFERCSTIDDFWVLDCLYKTCCNHLHLSIHACEIYITNPF